MKYVCCKCNNLSIWWYMPGKDNDTDYYCDDHVPRGCSCNIHPDTGIEDTDDKGRFYPCCEYHFDDRGFDDE